ncbi:MFS transporter [Legionella maioricensis]|uniref:Tetracycline resistance protein n=1 Tax=Legionella maioricensis TaxID=2896528 RepID=A0A9X2CZ98_9GAMM|nr:MFS transporter [Legionella maioricensis]MCL9683531.1 MFS transporter [Legionella maioricensis]MCL9686830.1 MFS transporter [Legionella maioricensis]
MAFFNIFCLLSYISIASFSAAIITPALPEIQQQYALLQGQVEWIVSVFLVGYVFGQLIYGPLANRFGRITALRIGLLINLLGILVCFTGLFLHVYSILIMGRFINALGAASGLACTFMLINEWLPAEQRRTAMAYTILSFTLGIGLAVILGGMITEYSHWENCFIFLLGHGLLMLYGTRLFSETLTTPQAIDLGSILSGYRSVLSSGTLLIYSLVVGLCSAIGYCFSAAGPQIVMELFHLSPAEYSYWNLLNMTGMLAGGLLAKELLQRYKANNVVFFGLIGTALGLVSMIVMVYSGNGSVLWFFTSTLFLYLFSGLLFAGGSYIASNAVNDKASGAAMMSFINMTSATLAVISMGYISSLPLFAFIAVLASFWILIFIILGVQRGLEFVYNNRCMDV